METDMDIDMDLGIDPMENESTLHSSYLPADLEAATSLSEVAAIAPLSDSDANQLVQHKVHLRGLDNLTSTDIEAFASEYFVLASFDKIEWINDTSANLVYGTADLALQALHAFTYANIAPMTEGPILRMLPAKPFPAHPEIRLEARLAVLGDRKQAGARERSRFYLFNPEHDPTERRKREGRSRKNGNYRDREDSTHIRREDEEIFSASLYDDDEMTLAVRASKNHLRGESHSSLSSIEYRGQGIRKIRTRRGGVKELFPDRVARRRGGGRLRDRSASPRRDDEGDQSMDITLPEQSRSRHHNSIITSSANRLQAQLIKARLKEASMATKELFPQKAPSNHRRSDAFDATEATADLFASKMPVPFLDGSSDDPSRKQDLLSRVTKTNLEDSVTLANGGDRSSFRIRGAAGQQQDKGISIKGKASVTAMKELFPHKTGLNSGKELFSEKLEGRGGKRRRAEDMY